MHDKFLVCKKHEENNFSSSPVVEREKKKKYMIYDISKTKILTVKNCVPSLMRIALTSMYVFALRGRQKNCSSDKAGIRKKFQSKTKTVRHNKVFW